MFTRRMACRSDPDEGSLEELCGVLQPHAGTYALSTFPMTVELTPTTIMDRNGNVIKVIK